MVKPLLNNPVGIVRIYPVRVSLNNGVKPNYSVFVKQMINNPLDKYQMSNVNSELIYQMNGLY
jgi:hypothetical protein